MKVCEGCWLDLVLSSSFEASEARLCSQGGLDQLFSLLEECDFRDYAVFIALETVWNVLELNPTAKELVCSAAFAPITLSVPSI